MKLTVLGCGTDFSAGSKANSGYLIDNGANQIVLDLGPGAQASLRKATDFMKVNALFFSHYSHPDHVADLVAFIIQRRGFVKFGLSNEKNELKLFGPKGFAGFFSKLGEAFPSIAKAEFKISVQELDYGGIKLFGYEISVKPVKHGVPAIGFRVESNGKTIAYSGDTEYCQEIVDLGKDADLLILECTVAGKKEFHLSPEECARVASEAKAKKLLLTHFWPEAEQIDAQKIARQKFKGEVLVARDLMGVEV